MILKDILKTIKNAITRSSICEGGEKMRVLDGAVFYHIAGLLLAMVFIILLNIYFYMNKVVSRLGAFFYIGSFLLLCALLMQYLIEATLELDFERYFVLARNTLFPLSLIALVPPVVLNIVAFRKKDSAYPSFSDLSGLFKEVEDSIIIFDALGQVVRIHDKYEKLKFMDQPIISINQIKSFMPKDSMDIHERPNKFNITTEKDNVTFQVTITDIKNNENKIIGFAVAFHDITDYQNLLLELKKKNQFLKEANERLIHEVELSEQLASEQQRLSLITDIQRQLISQLEKTILKIDELEKKAEKGVHPKKAQILQLSEELNSLYGKVHEVVRTISPKKGRTIE